MQLQWFNRWLKQSPPGKDETPPARLFVMGSNQWQPEQEWPPAQAREVQWFLESAGKANGLSGDGRLVERRPRRRTQDSFVYDPRKPVPTRGGAVCCDPAIFPWGPMDQRPVEKRSDVLVYTSSSLKRDVQVIGPVKVVVYVSTSAPDTDFTAKLVDVYPDGRAVNLCDGILRLRYRESLEKPKLAQVGETYRITINAGVTANVFRKGHRMRLEISSSNFPRFDRNPNTGARVADEVRLRAATQTIYHDPQRPSHLLMSVVR
jgi:putative CocE/NonD family hydrolase